MKNERIFNLIIKSFQNEIGEEFSTQEIKNRLNDENIYPSDYCYNSYNKGSKDIYLFEKIKNGLFKYLGKDYLYTGAIYHKPKGEKKEIIVGKWVNGEREIYNEKFIDKDEQFVSIYNEYRNFLKNSKTKGNKDFPEQTIKNQIKILSKIIPVKLGIENLFLIKDIEYIKGLYKQVTNGGDLQEWNIRGKDNGGKNGASSSLYQYIKFLEHKKGSKMQTKNIILYGAPGVGKTHNTNKLISLIDKGKSEKEIFSALKENKNETITLNDDLKSRVKFITFHQSFGYEDFIEGFRPNNEGNIKIEKGIFHNICTEAIKEENKDKNYYLVIDEINRGNISKIFGELITLIEEDKRVKIEVALPYSKETFKVPSNLFIIGTMNSTDKSIALIDIALRRRFTFLKMSPNETLVPQIAKRIFNDLNKKISETIGEDYKIGHSYFMNISNEDDLNFVLEYKITPLLEEYFYGNKEQLDEILKIIKG